MGIELRPGTLDDAPACADLLTARTPDDPSDGVMLAYWWANSPSRNSVTRWAGEREGRLVMFIAAGHEPWSAGATRYGWVRCEIHPEAWSDQLFSSGVNKAESQLRSYAAQVATTSVRADLENDLRLLASMGYREVRRTRFWELDLVARRDELLAGAAMSRTAMDRQGTEMLTLAQADDDETLEKIYRLDLAATEDEPTTVPHYVLPFDAWWRMYFESPGVRKDRFWIARFVNEVVGMSLLEYPPDRGIPSTKFTGTSPRFRGMGIARALKYETVAQAIAVGATRVRTSNDSENAPILHLNAAMGYEPITPKIELHRRL